MDKPEPEKLDYIAPQDDEDSDVPGVSRYYRELPELLSLLAIVVCLLVAAGMLFVVWFLRVRGRL